jgi:hypothetical protein
MGNARQLQCNALPRREKSRRRRNNEEQWKKQCAEQWKQVVECTPKMRHKNKEEFSMGELDAQTQTPSI